MNDLLITALLMLAGLVLATVRFSLMIAQDRKTRVTLDEFWERFWAGHSPMWVQPVGAAGQAVSLGTVTGRALGGQRELVSAGFSLRAEDGRVVEVPQGTKVTLFIDSLIVVHNFATLPATTRLMTRLVETHAEQGGPLRDGASGLVIPEDMGLLLSDRSIRQTPFSTFHRTPNWGRVVIMWLVGIGLVTAAWAVPRFLALALGFAVLAIAVAMMGSVLYYLLTRDAPTPTESVPTMEPAASDVFRVDFEDGLEVGSSVIPAPKPGILYVLAPGGSLTEDIKNAVLNALYHRTWRSGNSDGSRYIVKRFNVEALGVPLLAEKVWRIDEARSDILSWRFVPDPDADEEGAYRTVDCDELEAVLADRATSD